MWELLKTLLASKQFIPHGHCYLWNLKLVGLHIVSDCLIALAYFSIPITLLYFVRKRQDLPFNWIFLLVGLFITFCGITHLMEIWTLWHPVYWLSGCIKAITALISLYTASEMMLLMPKALALPSPAQLELANRELEREIIERQRIEEALIESQAKYKTLFKIFPIGISITDQAGNLIEANPASQKILGISTAEHTTLKYDAPEWVSIRPDGTPMSAGEFASVRALTENRVVENIEMGIVQAEGKITWISVTAAPIPLAEYGVAIAYIDITDRQLALSALRESEERFRSAFDYAAVGMAMVALDGHWLKVNHSLCESIGYTEQELKSLTFQNLTHPEDLETDLNYVRQVLAGEIRTYQMEKRYFHKEGHIIWIFLSVSLVHNAQNKPMYFISQIQDISAHKRAERELELQSIIVKNMAGGVSLVRGIDKTIVYANPKFESMFGYNPGELNGKPVDVVNYEDDRENAKQTTAKITSEIEKYGEATYQVHNVKKDGTPFWCRAQASLFKHPEHGMVYVAVHEDITALAAAQDASIAKSRFLSNMSHELRTPLNIILGFSQVIVRSNSLSSDQKEQLKIINRSGEHLLELINDILSISKIEAGQVTLNENRFDLYQLLNDLEQMLQIKTAVKNLDLIFKRAADVPQYVQTDESKLRQVLINLLGNAIKFTKSGSVTLRVRLATGDSQSSQSDGSRYNGGPIPHTQFPITFEVEDTGSGIAPDEIDTLFDLFVQTQTGRKSMEGTGLGLPISREFVRLMGGDIIVNSQMGRGTTFTFDVLVRETAPVDQKTSFTTKRVIGVEANQPIYRILVVEDLKENRLLMVKLLEPLGFQVREAVNGTEAITLWSTWEPHLIWMDMRMPVMDGYEATRQIKATLKGQATVIIALTANAFEEEREKVLSAGCDDFVRKPFRESVLFDKIAQHLGVRYVYEDENQIASQLSATIPKKLIPEDLSVMPPEWVVQLHEAVLCANDALILQLIAQIPDNEANLAYSLTDLVNNFRLDLLFDLTKASTNE